MNPFYAETGVDALGVVVSPQEIASLDVTPALKLLRTVLYDAETVRMFRGRVGIAFEGYDNDSRELYEIPEVRHYILALDAKFPYWFYFLPTHDDTLKLIAFCLCRTKKIKPGLAVPDGRDLQRFMILHFDAVNRLFSRFQLDETINQEISESIADVFCPEEPSNFVESNAHSDASFENSIAQEQKPGSFRLDYGLRLQSDGISPDLDRYFHNFRLYSLNVLGRGLYTTMVHMPYRGEMHALSLDFNDTHLALILEKASEQLRSYVMTQLAADPTTSRTIDFEGEVSFGVRARLGEIQVVKHERFIPLVAQEIT